MATGSSARRSRSATRPARTPRTSRAGRSRWPPSSRPRRRRRCGGAAARLLAPAHGDPGRAGRGPARQGAARSPGRHPLGRGRRPGRLGHRRRLRRRLPRGRDRPGEPAAGRGGGEDQGPPAVRGDWPWPRRSTTGRRSAAAKREDAAGAARLSEAARVADPDPWRNELRDRPGSTRQGGPADRDCRPWPRRRSSTSWAPISLHLLGTGSERCRRQRAGRVGAADGPAAASAATSGSTTTWGGCWRSCRAATRRFASTPPPGRSAPRRPTSWPMPCEKRGDSDEAIAVFRDLTRLRPGNARHLGCLGSALKDKGLSREADEALEAAVAAGREAIRLKPDDADGPLQPRHRPGRARASSTRPSPNTATAIRLKPDDADAHNNLGNALASQGKLDEAIAAYRDGDPAQARRRRGPHQPRRRPARAQGKLDEADRRIPRRRSGSSPTTPTPTPTSATP